MQYSKNNNFQSGTTTLIISKEGKMEHITEIVQSMGNLGILGMLLVSLGANL